jgi:nanoRNase/pAp phosphatase (c-di-AMP/oligoRNAs hydrolase)
MIPGEIAAFDIVQGDDEIISRYAPYHFYADARYSIGVIRSSKHVRISAMRNPWREFNSVPLGKIFEKHGGGGHQRVAALVVPDAAQTKDVLNDLVEEIRRSDLADQKAS